MRINFNSSTSVLNASARTTQKISKIFEQLSTGKKINRAGDDPAASALANTLKSNLGGLEAANRNISNAQGSLRVASGAIGQSVEQLQRLREVAVQAANGTLSDSDRTNLQQEFSQGIQNLNDISSRANFNGQNLLDGSYNVSIQTGAEAGQTSEVSVGNVSASALGVADQNVNTQAAASDAIDAIDSAIQTAIREQSQIGASESALEFRENANAIERENLEAARSQAEDADFAEATSNLSKEQVIQQAQIAVLKEQIKQKFAVANEFFGKK